MSVVTIAFSHLKTCSVNLPASWANSLYSKVIIHYNIYLYINIIN